eukprot:TRINITY_DN6810_c0_g1_i1.p1 TRINITY_DN6810_c0_g1~~TRINITY_DN6810_c0_g1_i1.p1  ORF type:complete len:400 (+),score=86.63 TRINITY_DN6810_c0_g1_i1:142-1200(+)
MALWLDKYKPQTLDQMDYHKEQAQQLKKMIESEDFPHLLVYGPPGSGKKTRISAILRELYGSNVSKLKVEHKQFKPSTSVKEIEVVLVTSPHHVELNPSDSGNQDRLVVQDVIKEIAQNIPIDGLSHGFKIVVLNEVDKLSREAQHALRRTMEKWMSVCRLILCCTSTAKVIDPVKSRCLPIRVPAPRQEEIMKILSNISKKEGITLPDEFSARIAEASDGNLRRAILMLEASKVKHYPFDARSQIQIPDWEEFLIALAREIAEEQSPKKLLVIRGKLYELLAHCIPPEIILKKLTQELLKKLDTELKYEVVKWAAFYEHRMQLGSKPIFHLEAFVAKFMSIYKRFLLNAFE